LGPSASPTRAPPSPPSATLALACHQSMGAVAQALRCVDLSRFASMVMTVWSWIHGSTIMDLEPSNRPPNQFPVQIFACATSTTAFGSQPRPYDRKVVKSRAGPCPHHAAWHPSVAQSPPPTSSLPPCTSDDL
jgi:hypothetical protein